MKKLLFFLLVLAASISLGQDIVGKWSGNLILPNGKLRVDFNITKSDSSYSGSFDSPDQNAMGFSAKKVTYNAPNLSIEIPSIGASYQGVFDASTKMFKGHFSQAGNRLPLDLSFVVATESKKINRPQEPREPFPYKQQEVTFFNKKNGVTLAGTLSLPNGKGPFAAVVLVTGSGQQNRDEEIMGHKPFLVISDFLVRNGIAVLRYDDRGAGKSTGDFTNATTFDFAEDADAAIAFLKKHASINPKKIGIAGHSEGGSISVIEANRNKDVAFIVSLAGPTIQGSEILIMQNSFLLKDRKVDEKIIQQNEELLRKVYGVIIKENDTEKVKTDIAALYKGMQASTPSSADQQKIDDAINRQVSGLTSPWTLGFIRYNPQDDIEKVKQPMLFLIGEKDVQVPAEPNVAALRSIIKNKGKRNISIRVIPNSNHLFQQCKTCNLSEYSSIEETFSPLALQIMCDWIKSKI